MSASVRSWLKSGLVHWWAVPSQPYHRNRKHVDDSSNPKLEVSLTQKWHRTRTSLISIVFFLSSSSSRVFCIWCSQAFRSSVRLLCRAKARCAQKVHELSVNNWGYEPLKPKLCSYRHLTCDNNEDRSTKSHWIWFTFSWEIKAEGILRKQPKTWMTQMKRPMWWDTWLPVVSVKPPSSDLQIFSAGLVFYSPGPAEPTTAQHQISNQHFFSMSVDDNLIQVRLKQSNKNVFFFFFFNSKHVWSHLSGFGFAD